MRFFPALVNRRFPAHGAVHQRQQGGGHLDIGKAAQIGGRREPGEVAHHAAAQRDDAAAALYPQHREAVEEFRELGERFAALARGHGAKRSVAPAAPERTEYPLAQDRSHVPVGDDERPPARKKPLRRLTEAAQGAPADRNRVAPLPQMDPDASHAAASAL